MAEPSEADHAALVARNAKRRNEALGILGVPERLRPFCDCVIDDDTGPRAGFVTVTTAEDVSTEDLNFLAALGFGLFLRPASQLDLRDLTEGLGKFDSVHGSVGTKGQVAGVAGLDALEHAVSATGIYLDGDEPADIDLSGLRLLTRAGGIPVVNAAAKNPHIRVISQGFSELPSDFTCAYPLEELTARVPRSFRDLSCLSDRSALTRLDIRGAATFDFTDMVDCAALEVVQLFQCREVLGFETLAGLPKLKTVTLETPRSIPGLDNVQGLSFALRIPANYVVPREQQARLTPKVDPDVPPFLRSYFGKFKLAIRPRVTEASRLTLVDGKDSTTFAPFEVAASKGGTGFTIVFEDWDGLAEILFGEDGNPDVLNGDVGDQLASRILAKDAPELLRDGGIEFDSEAALMMIQIQSLEAVELAVRTLAIAWSNKRRMRSLTKGLL